ncbi:MAG: L-threonine kinase [Chloroflexota bacterium]|nr:L-threonine kinase [Chloroflexota bacterium]
MHSGPPIDLSPTASMPCTCGELFQGSLEGEPCLVSCPIAVFSTAGAVNGGRNPAPPGRKARRALRKWRRGWGRQLGVWVRQPLPVGRGYGTSTADIGAALAAACKIDGRAWDAQAAACMAVGVEPTDSTLFPGLTLFAHRSAKFQHYLGTAPAARLLIIDPGGRVDSQAFNRRNWHSHLDALSDAHQDAFDMLREGIETADLELMGQAASLSSRLHQRLLFNALLDEALWLAEQVGALGVCRAHSGTILGLILPPEREDLDDLIRFGRRHLPAGLNWFATRLTDGGPRFPSEAVIIDGGEA